MEKLAKKIEMKQRKNRREDIRKKENKKKENKSHEENGFRVGYLHFLGDSLMRSAVPIERYGGRSLVLQALGWGQRWQHEGPVHSVALRCLVGGWVVTDWLL